MLHEIEERRRQAKKKKQFNKIIRTIDIGLITSSAIAGGTSTLAVASSVGLPVGAALGRFSVILSLSTIITRKSSRSLTVKQGKHNAIKLLAQAKLDSISNIISQEMQDGDIFPTEFHKVLQEVEKYCKLKTDIRNQAKAKVKQITEEQREEIFEQGRKEGKEDFLRKITNTSSTQGANVIQNMNLPHPTVCNFMVYKDYKSDLKFIFPICGIDFRIQQLTCSFINHCITIHHNIFMKSIPCEFSYRIIR